ncbi:Beta-1,3-galactosyltransferase 1 [Tyrophagus putrescentiae]|nr:Beta-1,3-galactosyltransferase 1 [Tyrophagus putrescentiae]
MAIRGFNRIRLLRALVLLATCCLFLIIQNLANRYHNSVYQLTPYSELTATYEATIASVSIQENILLVDYQNCFEESEKAAEAAAAQDEGDEEDGRAQIELRKRGTPPAKWTSPAALIASSSRRANAATTTTRKTSTSTSTVTSNLNSTASTSSSSSSLKDLYLLQSWLNASFAFQGRGDAAGSSEDYRSLLERFNLSSLAAHFDPVRRLADKYLYLSLRHVEQLDTILRHNFSADGVVNPVDASIDLRRGGRRGLSEFADITRIRHGAQSCEKGGKVCKRKQQQKNNTYGAALTAVVFVITKPDDFAIRQRIRDTWGSQFSASANSPIRLYFAFGREPALANESAPLPDPEALELSELRVAEEAAQHGDIVQWAFADGYYRLTIKSVAILRWASVYCPRVPALFKIDADCLLNYDALRRFSAAVARNQTATGGYYIYGNLWRGAPVLRSAKSKFYTSFLDYPQPVYPDYAGGAWYLAGPQLPLFMFRVAVLHSMPALLWEDLYVTGIVAEKLIHGGSRFPLTRHYMVGFDYNIDPAKFDYCAFNRSIILSQAFNEDNLPEMWARVTRRTMIGRKRREAALNGECTVDW